MYDGAEEGLAKGAITQLSRSAIAYLLKNGCKLSPNEEDPDFVGWIERIEHQILIDIALTSTC